MAMEIHMTGCECGCDCCETMPKGKDKKKEREVLLRQKALIEERLEQLERV